MREYILFKQEWVLISGAINIRRVESLTKSICDDKVESSLEKCLCPVLKGVPLHRIISVFGFAGSGEAKNKSRFAKPETWTLKK